MSHLEEVFEHEDEAQGVTPPKRDLVPLLAVMRPAVTDAVIAAWSEMSTTFDEGGAAGAFLVGGQLAVPFLPARLKTGVGIGFDGALDEARFAVNVGLVTNLLLTVNGLFSHEIDAGALFLVGDSPRRLAPPRLPGEPGGGELDAPLRNRPGHRGTRRPPGRPGRP